MIILNYLHKICVHILDNNKDAFSEFVRCVYFQDSITVDAALVHKSDFVDEHVLVF